MLIYTCVTATIHLFQLTSVEFVLTLTMTIDYLYVCNSVAFCVRILYSEFRFIQTTKREFGFL